LGWDQTEQGARNRAMAAYSAAVALQSEGKLQPWRVVALGIESGIMGYTDTGATRVDQTIVAVYDGVYTSITVSEPTQVPQQHLDLLTQCQQDQSVTFGKLFAPQGVALDGSPLTHDDWHRYIGPSRYLLIEQTVTRALCF
jgi:non-canonical (house-cleaning) NTP pyrophosphatase